MNNQKFDRGVGLIYKYHKSNHCSPKSWRLMLKTICASTEIELSKWITEKPVKKNQPIAIFSSCQRFGKGQAGRIWHAPKGGVWVSAAIKSEGSCENNSQLYGLAVALALVERIERIGIDVKIKWPNDLLVDDQKFIFIVLSPIICFSEIPSLGTLLKTFKPTPTLNNLSFPPLKNNLGKIPANFWPSTNRSFGHFIFTSTPIRSILSTKANATANP